MGAHKDNGIIHVAHKWRDRAQRAEAALDELLDAVDRYHPDEDRVARAIERARQIRQEATR